MPAMRQLAGLAVLSILWPLAISAGEPSSRPMAVSEHDALSRPIPMAIAGSRYYPVGPAETYFRGIEKLGFICEAEDITRWRVRRVKVTCSRVEEVLLYEGGFSRDRGSVIFDRVSRRGELLGGTELAEHVNTLSRAAAGDRQLQATATR